jgi:cytochrome c oxidase assembly protein subunit 15
MYAQKQSTIALWLLICALMVFCTLIIGGATRLTHSGLSIVEWKPIAGVVPPLNQADWQAEFDKYKQTPEYAKVNHQMVLDEFKGIFWWEFLHRVSGRLIGLVFAVPYLYFLLRRRIHGPLGWKLAGIFLLGGMQGAMGWYMVKSGLVDDPRVSQYRLTAHLSLAFIIFTAMVWVALGLLRPRVAASSTELQRLHRWGIGLAALTFYMVVTGGFVAGIRAGKAYNTFPLMNGDVVPPEIFVLEPWYLNFFSNMATVQFDHRLGAWLLAFTVPWFWVQIRQAQVSARCRQVANLLLLALAVQITLGISTLLLAVPVVLGTSHQGGAMLLFGVVLWLNHELRASAQQF